MLDDDDEHIPDFVPAGADRACESGPVRLLGYPEVTYRVAHICDRGDRGRIRCAPVLDPDGHQVEWSGTWPTVTPSISCPDCGLHGHMTNGVWTPVPESENR